jgi:hypothetical protein
MRPIALFLIAAAISPAAAPTKLSAIWSFQGSQGSAVVYTKNEGARYGLLKTIQEKVYSSIS